MIEQPLQRIGKTYVLVVPDEEVERLGLATGQVVGYDLWPIEHHDTLRPDLKTIFEELWEKDRDAYEYLAER